MLRSKDKNGLRFVYAVLLLGAVLVLWQTGFSEEAVFAFVKRHLEDLQDVAKTHTALFIAAFVLLHAGVITALIPVSSILMLLAGALFGPVYGALIAASSNTLGGTISFLLFRRVLRTTRTEERPHLPALHAAIRRSGWMYVLILRTMPFLPSQVVSMIMSITSIRMVPFILGTWLGSIPSSAFFVYMGQNFLTIERVGDLLTFEVVGLLLGLVAFLLVIQWYLHARTGGFHPIREDIRAFIRWKAGLQAR